MTSEGDGRLSVPELARAASSYKASKRTNRRLLWAIAAGAALLVALIVGEIFLTAALVDSYKDTDVEGGVLVSSDDSRQPVATAGLTNSVPLSQIYKLPSEAFATLRHVGPIPLPDGTNLIMDVSAVKCEQGQHCSLYSSSGFVVGVGIDGITVDEPASATADGGSTRRLLYDAFDYVAVKVMLCYRLRTSIP